MKNGWRKEIAALALIAAGGALIAKKKKVASGLGFLAAAFYLWPARSSSLYDQSVVITGGSRGLGLALAEVLLQQGARLTLLARDAEELKRAQLQLKKISPLPVDTLVCDVTSPEQLAVAFERIALERGGIDVLINNAGAIAAGPFEVMEDEDYRAQMDLHLHAIVAATQMIRPYFHLRGGGRVANICSLGGKMPLPHMTTYSASKFALAGFSESVAAELALENIWVTTVYPGLMRTGSTIQAVFKGQTEKEFAWFATGDAIPGLSMNALTAAKKIISAIKNRESQIVISSAAKIGSLMHSLFPELFAGLMRLTASLMPPADRYSSYLKAERKTGAQSSNWLYRQFWSAPIRKMNRKAEARFNQKAKEDGDFNLGL